MFCLEHGIQPEGHPVESDQSTSAPLSAAHTFFAETRSGKHIPRAILVDTEATVLDEVRKGRYCQLYHPDTVISGKEDSADNFARGYFNLGKTLITRLSDQIRRMAEASPNLQGSSLNSSIITIIIK